MGSGEGEAGQRSGREPGEMGVVWEAGEGSERGGWESRDALMVGGGLSPQFQKLSNGKYHSLMTGPHLQSYKRTMGVLANRGGAAKGMWNGELQV